MPPIDPLVLELLDEIEAGKTPEEACSGHPALLAEVRARLARLEQVREDLDALFPEAGAALGSRGPGAPPAPPEIPGHLVEAELGRGGMGVVYRARHLRLNRLVAVKTMLNGGHAGPPELARFFREAEALAAVGHPNIVEIHEVGDVDGLPYFTMEYVEGDTLAQRLGGVPLPAPRAADLVATLADAVHAAHAAGIVHRDLKPANILMAAGGAPKITDFGLAWRGGAAAGAGLTRPGTRVGTPSYMAPEQAAGQPDAFGPATDVYALGAILYEMLTGRPPFRAETASETERQVVHDDPVPPSRLNSRVPRDLETICLTCLHKDPQRRYATATALAADLRRFRGGQPIAARPAGPLEVASKWARRHPARAAAVAAGGAVAAVLLGLAWWALAERAATIRSVQLDLQAAGANLRSSSWAAARTDLERARLRLPPGGPAALRGRLEGASRDLALVERLAEIRDQGAESGQVDFDRSRADADYRLAFRNAGLGGPDEPAELVASRVATRDVRGPIVAALDDWAHRTRHADRQSWILEVARRADPAPASAWRSRARDPALWLDLAALSGLVETAEVKAESVSLLLCVATRYEAAGGDCAAFLRKVQAAHSGDFWANFGLAETLDQRRDPEAQAFYRAALALRPRSVASHVNLGLALYNQGRRDEALECYRRALEIRPGAATVQLFLANGLYASARFEEAMVHCREALRIDPGYADAMGLMGVLLERGGRFAEARGYFARAIERYPAGGEARDFCVAHLGDCDRAVALEARLPAIARGAERCADREEAMLCVWLLAGDEYFAAAARIYTEALAEPAGPGAAPGPEEEQRIHAAYAAAAAGCGMGKDAAGLGDHERASLRSRALAWLEAERDAQARRIRDGGEERGGAIQLLRAWQAIDALAGVREDSGLAELPGPEAEAWRSFWRGIEPLTARDAREAIGKARELAARGAWAAAADGYAHAIATEPTDNGEVWFEYAAVQLLSGDLPGYHQACAVMLDRCQTMPRMRPYHAARACTLAAGPEGPPNAARAALLAAAELGDHAASHWALTERGALAHRAGRPGEAVPLLERSLGAEPRPGSAVVNWLWLSLAFRQLGQLDRAAHHASMAESWLDRGNGAMPSDAGASGLHLHNWLEAQALRLQAAETTNEGGGPEPPGAIPMPRG